VDSLASAKSVMPLASDKDGDLDYKKLQVRERERERERGAVGYLDQFDQIFIAFPE